MSIVVLLDPLRLIKVQCFNLTIYNLLSRYLLKVNYN
jgi:hypothetical protein